MQNRLISKGYLLFTLLYQNLQKIFAIIYFCAYNKVNCKFKEEIMKAIIDTEACVGCALCANMCAEVYKMEDDKAIILGDSIPDDILESAKEAATSCPVEAIKIEG